jgi:hypothetical protein
MKPRHSRRRRIAELAPRRSLLRREAVQVTQLATQLAVETKRPRSRRRRAAVRPETTQSRFRRRLVVLAETRRCRSRRRVVQQQETSAHSRRRSVEQAEMELTRSRRRWAVQAQVEMQRAWETAPRRSPPLRTGRLEEVPLRSPLLRLRSCMPALRRLAARTARAREERRKCESQRRRRRARGWSACPGETQSWSRRRGRSRAGVDGRTC